MKRFVNCWFTVAIGFGCVIFCGDVFLGVPLYHGTEGVAGCRYTPLAPLERGFDFVNPGRGLTC